MKAGKNENDTGEITGKVIKKLFAAGSKSEHIAVCIETETEVYKLKRMGGNPFADPVLEKLVGKQIIATGKIDDYQFIATNIAVVSSEGQNISGEK